MNTQRIIWSLFFLFVVLVGMNAFTQSKEVDAENRLLHNPPDESSQWAYFYQGLEEDGVSDVTQTSDGGFVMVGYTSSFGSGNMDLWVVKLNEDGSVLWEKTYGDANLEYASDVTEAENGDLLITGTMFVFSGQGMDWGYRILRLSATGEVIWQKQFEDVFSDENSILETTDQGIVIGGGWSQGNDDGTSIVKLDHNGNFLWQKLYDDQTLLFDGTYFSIDETPDGDFIATFPNQYGDQWIARLDSQGNIEWQKFLDGYFYRVTANAIGNEGFYVSGGTSENSMILRLSPTGEIIWQKSLVLNSTESLWAADITNDEGIILAINVLDTLPSIKLVRVDADGNLLWSHSYEGGRVQDVEQTNDEEYIVVGNEYPGNAAPPYPWALKDGNGYTQPEAFPTLDGNYDVSVFNVDANGNINGCDLIDTTNIVITDTYVILTDADVTPLAITPVISDTFLTPQTSNVTPVQVCYFLATSTPTPTPSPTATDTPTVMPTPTLSQTPTPSLTPTLTPPMPPGSPLYLPIIQQP